MKINSQCLQEGPSVKVVHWLRTCFVIPLS